MSTIWTKEEEEKEENGKGHNCVCVRLIWCIWIAHTFNDQKLCSIKNLRERERENKVHVGDTFFVFYPLNPRSIISPFLLPLATNFVDKVTHEKCIEKTWTEKKENDVRLGECVGGSLGDRKLCLTFKKNT